MQQNLKLAHVKITSGTGEEMVTQVGEWIAEGSHKSCIPLNLSKYVMSRKNEKLRNAINDADVVVADGIPITWLAKRLGQKNVHRVTGVELAEDLLALATKNKWRLYFLGSKPENLEAALENIKNTYNDPIIAGSRDGYFSESDVPDIIADINKSAPDILFLGLGLPQKEYFVADHFADLDVRFCVTVGGAIDIWAGAKNRAPALVQKMGLEWLFRSFYDLSRAGLIFRYGMVFLKDLILPPRKT